jgi:hypothetical protein
MPPYSLLHLRRKTPMNTPAHLLLAAAVFAKPDSPKITSAAIIGGLIPDVSLYVMAAFSLFVLGNTPDYVFNVQYFSDNWQQVFAVDNSFILWGILLAFALWIKKDWLIALSGGAFLHLCFDFALHRNDARMQFWPLSDWVFRSPFSYWDNAYYGATISTLEQSLVLGLLFLLWRKFKSLKMRIFYAILAALNVAPHIIFGLMH